MEIQRIIASVDADYEAFAAECDAKRKEHGEWLAETIARTEKQLLHSRCARGAAPASLSPAPSHARGAGPPSARASIPARAAAAPASAPPPLFFSLSPPSLDIHALTSALRSSLSLPQPPDPRRAALAPQAEAAQGA